MPAPTIAPADKCRDCFEPLDAGRPGRRYHPGCCDHRRVTPSVHGARESRTHGWCDLCDAEVVLDGPDEDGRMSFIAV